MHHRFLWIHPFLDGNGRVARLMSHALLKRLGIGTSLWSVARGLARSKAEYKALLMQADQPRDVDCDGRRNLTQRGLIAFSQFFLDHAIDQARFMSDLLEPEEMLRRMEIHIEEEVRAKRLPRGSFAVLREAALASEVPRGKVGALTNYEERAARMVSAGLLERGMLTSANHRAPLRLRFPAEVPSVGSRDLTLPVNRTRRAMDEIVSLIRRFRHVPRVEATDEDGFARHP